MIWPALGVAFALLTAPRAAGATIDEDVDRVVRAVTPHAGSVTRLPARFLEEGDAARFVLPPRAPLFAGCRIVVFVASPNVRFSATVETNGGTPPAASPAPQPPPASDAGMMTLRLCTAEETLAEGVVARMTSARGAVAAILIDGTVSDVDPVSILTDRAREPRLPPRSPGPALAVRSLAERTAAFGERARRRGYEPMFELDVAKTAEREGVVALELSAGCHVVGTMVEPDGGRVDADLVLERADDGRVLAVDKTEAPDGEVKLCLAEPTPVQARVRASHPFEAARTTVASQPLPASLDPGWGSLATSTYANLFVRRQGPTPRQRASVETLGVQGTTQMTFTPVVGRCYLAGLALARGPSRGMRLRARMDAQTLSEETPRPEDGLALVLCSENGAPIRLTVDVPSPQAWWLLSIWSLEENK